MWAVSEEYTLSANQSINQSVNRLHIIYNSERRSQDPVLSANFLAGDIQTI